MGDLTWLLFFLFTNQTRKKRFYSLLKLVITDFRWEGEKAKKVVGGQESYSVTQTKRALDGVIQWRGHFAEYIKGKEITVLAQICYF